MMKGERLYKVEKLRSNTVIEHLFTSGSDVGRALTFPLRVVWSVTPARPDSTCCPRFLVMIPKRRIRHAVDRVKMRRRVREAYRLNRRLLPADVPLEIVFVYVDNKLSDYQAVERAMTRLLSKIARSLASTATPPAGS